MLYSSADRNSFSLRPHGKILNCVIIMVITLFQENNIWHECQSNIWSSYTKTYSRLIITDRTKIIYSMYRAGEVSVHRTCCKRATQPYSFEGGGTIYPGSRPAVTTRSPRMVAECLLTRSMLIKMYCHFMVCACICAIVFTVSQFHADVYLVYLVFQIA